MEDKPKKKWVSSRLKDKKKELGIEDKMEEKKPSKPVKKVHKGKGDKFDFNKRGSGKRSSYKKGSKKGSYKRGSYKKGSKNKSYNRNREKHVIKMSNLPSDISVGELAELISPWGEIGNINIKNYSEAYVSYIDFYNKNEADYFIKAIDQTPFDNCIIRAELMNFS